MTDIQALRAHLVAEAEYAKRQADKATKRLNGLRSDRPETTVAYYATTARTATDAWLAADTRLRTLDALIASAVAVRP